MSDLEDKIKELLKAAFPRATIKEQYFVKYNGASLIFDFYIPSVGVLVECQGAQHYKFVAHFHGTKDEYESALRRDKLKQEYALKNKMFLLEIPYNKLPANHVDLFNQIYEGVNNA